MSIFSRAGRGFHPLLAHAAGLFRSRDKPEANREDGYGGYGEYGGYRPQNKLGSAFSFFFGGTSSGKNVTEQTALQTTAVYACVRLLAEAVAGLPVHIYTAIQATAARKRL